jgi:hypothetical protein
MALMVVTKYHGEICRVPYGRVGLVGFIACRVIMLFGGAWVGWHLAASMAMTDPGYRVMCMVVCAWILTTVAKVVIPGRLWVHHG